jgi:type IV pilus assembly protein PilE
MRSGARRAGGFTLIELMITVAIIGILTAIVYPSYRESIAKGRRAQLTTQMLAAQQFMERWYSENYDYSKNTANLSVNDADQFPKRFAKVPQEGGQYYALTVAPSATGYVLTAAPQGVMAGDKCGSFTLDNNGKKGVTGGTTTDVQTCWR